MNKITYQQLYDDHLVYPYAYRGEIVITDYTALVSSQQVYLFNGNSLPWYRSKQVVLPIYISDYVPEENARVYDATIYLDDVTSDDDLYPYIDYLSEFTIKYCPFPDNLISWPSWVLVPRCKGVILNMTDGNGNSLPYDWLNIQFSRFRLKQDAPIGIPTDASYSEADLAIFTAAVNTARAYADFYASNYVGEQELYGNSFDGYVMSPTGTRIFAWIMDSVIVEVETSPIWLYGIQNTAWSDMFLPNPVTHNVVIQDSYYAGFSNHRSLPMSVIAYSSDSDLAYCNDLYAHSMYRSTFFGNINYLNITGNAVDSLFVGTINHMVMRNVTNFVNDNDATVSYTAFVKDANTVWLKGNASNETVRGAYHEIIEFLIEYINYWKIPFNSLMNNNYEVRIFGAPGTTPIQIYGSESLVKTKETNNKFILESIRTSSGSISLMKGDYDSIMTIENLNRPVLIYKDNTVVWYGFIKPVQITKKLYDEKEMCDCTIMCPLYASKVIPFFNPDASFDMISIAAILASILDSISHYLKHDIAFVNIDYGTQFLGINGVPAEQAWLHSKIQNLWFFDENGDPYRNNYEAIEAICTTFGLTARFYKGELYLLAVDDAERGRDIVRVSISELWMAAYDDNYTIPVYERITLNEISLFNGPFASTNQSFTNIQALMEFSVSPVKNSRSGNFSFPDDNIRLEHYYDTPVRTPAYMTTEDNVQYFNYRWNKYSGYITVRDTAGSAHQTKIRLTCTKKFKAIEEYGTGNLIPENYTVPKDSEYYLEFKIDSGYYTRITSTIIFAYNAQIILDAETTSYQDDNSPVLTYDDFEYIWYGRNNQSIVQINKPFVGNDYYYGLVYVEGKIMNPIHSVWSRTVNISVEERVTPTYFKNKTYTKKLASAGFLGKGNTSPKWTQDNESPNITNRIIGADHYGNVYPFVLPESILERMVNYHKKDRDSYYLELLNSEMPEITPLSIVAAPNNKTVYPIAVEHDYSNDKISVTLIEYIAS